MRIAYLGTGDIGLPILSAVANSADNLVLVVTQPDRPSGRGLRTVVGPIKQWALAAGVPVFQPDDVNAEAALATLRAAQPDLLLVVAFGQYLRRAVRELAPLGAINFHPSLLPRHRGASPYQSTILSGDADAGVSIIRVAARMDAGAILAQTAVPIDAEATAGDLAERLSALGAELTLRVLAELAAGRATETPQDEAAATHAGKLTPEMGRVQWARPAVELDRLIRGLSPKPGAVARWAKAGSDAAETVKLLRSRLGEARADGRAPGEVLTVGPTGIAVAAGDGGSVLLRELQPAGGRVLSAADFANGRRVRPGQLWLDGSADA